jgi:hypothetical protein
VALTSALVAAVAWGISPIGNGGDGYWGYDKARLAVKRQAIAMVPPGQAVSTSYLLVPHLAHRRGIYEYPNPFHGKNWGIRDQHQHNPNQIRWIVVDTQTVSADDLVYLRELLASGEFRLRMNRDGMQVAERVKPAGRNG